MKIDFEKIEKGIELLLKQLGYCWCELCKEWVIEKGHKNEVHHT